MVIFGPQTQAVEKKPLTNFSEKLIKKEIHAHLSIAEDGDSDKKSQQFRNADKGLAGAPASVMQAVSKFWATRIPSSITQLQKTCCGA